MSTGSGRRVRLRGSGGDGDQVPPHRSASRGRGSEPARQLVDGNAGGATGRHPRCARYVVHPGEFDLGAGDRLVATDEKDGTGRSGEVLEVLGDDGPLRYRVRWEDSGEEVLLVPDGGDRGGGRGQHVPATGSGGGW